MKTKIKNNGYGLLAVLIVVIGFSMAACGGGDSDDSDAIPDTPKGVMATVQQESNNIIISWPGVPGTLQYFVYRVKDAGDGEKGQSASSSNPDVYKRIAIVTEDSYGNNAYSYTYSPGGLVPDIKYSFQVTAVNSYGESPRSSSVSTKSDVSFTTLTANTWSESIGGVAFGNEKWFKFTATATVPGFNGRGNTQFIHFKNDVMLQLYDSDGIMVGVQSNSSDDNFIPREVTKDEVYYIKATKATNNNDIISIEIGFTETPVPPGITATTLFNNLWTNSNFTKYDEQWFKITAGNLFYIHFAPGTLSSIYVQVYESYGTKYGSNTTLNSSNPYFQCGGGDYYIRVENDSFGTYKIGYSSSSIPPSS